MKKGLTIITLLSVLLLQGCFSNSDDTIVMGTEGAYPPFNFMDKNGKIAGFDVEIGKALCTEMKVKCTWVVSDWDGLIPALQAKKFDVIMASMAITAKRKNKINFTDKYYVSPVAFIRRKGTNFEVTAAAIKNKIVGVQGGTVIESFIKNIFPTVQMKAYKTQDEANLDLLNGRLDLVAAELVALVGFLKTNKGSKAERIGSTFNSPKYLGEGNAIGVRKEDTELLTKLNAAIKAIRSNGVYKKINDKYFSFDLYGN